MPPISSLTEATHDLPERFCEALAFYDELVQDVSDRWLARQMTLERFADWSERLMQHFEVEERLLGGNSPQFLNDVASQVNPPSLLDAGCRLVPQYRLGWGGQGEVWLAHDPELDRVVALKIMKPGDRGSQQSAAQLWREAELTGKLEHPNIVSIYDAGRGQLAANESPYYVMRVYGDRHRLEAISAFYARQRSTQDARLLVALEAFHLEKTSENEQQLRQAWAGFAFDDTQTCDQSLRRAVESLLTSSDRLSGRSLQDAIRAYHAAGRRSSDLRELLNRYIDVCNAMAYAHNRGIIHRDLKPQNIMLGEFGETMVADWGLAERIKAAMGDQSAVNALASGSRDLTAADSRFAVPKGTLQYMSPEQACECYDELTAATDIYALGGILYCILTGRAPRPKTSREELIRLARSGIVEAPSTHLRHLPKALEAICLKALAREPQGRYASATDLATDVSRWLGDEPVTAWPDPLHVKAKRWIKSHQSWVSAAVTAVLMSLLTLSVMVAFLVVSNHELAHRNGELGEDRALAQQSEQFAIDKNASTTAVMNVLLQVQNALADARFSSEEHQLKVAAALTDLEALVPQYLDRTSVDQESMIALVDLSDVILRTASAESDNSLRLDGFTGKVEMTANERSATTIAHAINTRAADIGREILAAHPAQVDTRGELAGILYDLGRLSLRLGETEQALSLGLASLELRDEAVQRDPDDKAALSALAESLAIVGDTYLRLDNPTSAAPHLRESSFIRERLAMESPNDILAQRELAAANRRRGDLALALEDVEEAIDYYSESLIIIDRLRDEHRSRPELRRDETFGQYKLAECLRVSGDLEQSAECFNEAYRLLSAEYEQGQNVELVRQDYAALTEWLASQAPELDALIYYDLPLEQGQIQAAPPE